MNIRSKAIMITAIACIIFSTSACSQLGNAHAATSAAAETAPEEHIFVDMETPEYSSDYRTKAEIPYLVTLDCRDTGRRLLFLIMELPEDMEIRAEDENWLLMSEDIVDEAHMYIFAYRSRPSGGEQIVFTPVIGTADSGFSEEDFSEIHSFLYARSVSWLEKEFQEQVQSGKREEMPDLEPDSSGFVSDEVLKMVYEMAKGEF